MAFNNKPHKFWSDRQRISYTTSFLSEIALLWWQPNLMVVPEPPIHSDWAKFVSELDKLVGEPDLTQASECALCSLKMQENHHINKYMIEFLEHAAYTSWNDIVLYGEFYQGLAKRIKDQLRNLDRPRTLEQLDVNALKCNNCYWERQHEKLPNPTPRTRINTSTGPTSSPALQAKPATVPRPSTENPNQPKKDLGTVLNADGKLTEAEKEWQRAKGLCFYCGEPPEKCQHKKTPTTSGQATFTISGEPPIEASIEEVPNNAPVPLGN